MKQYEYLGKSKKGVFCINGVDVLKCRWRSFGECAVVLHPVTKKPYAFSLYSVECGEKTVSFFAGKFDDDDWQFYSLNEQSAATL